ncbi:unnamed protein product [Bemisia tabaci]|uniref:RRM domain-containing protein n=1 Tax=Bemisia tabaci TaxID=7038 RepID=A0A9P0A1X8_BEMTA|nr:unnamed protein product [Bemisia tabaci]
MVGSRVYVGGLPYGCREKDLEKFFKGYGRIRDILLKNGYGFVEFEDNRDAEDAVYELNGRPLMGERITVERARGTDRSRRGFGGGGRFGGGGGGYGGGRRRTPDTFRYGPPRRTDYRVIVENLSSRISWQSVAT